MITANHDYLNIYSSPISGKLSVVLENGEMKNKKKFLEFFYASPSTYYLAFLDGKDTMVPFLSIEDNLLLGLSKKEKKGFICKLDPFLMSFKLDKYLLKKTASDIAPSEQILFQMIRSIILNQTIIIFDDSIEDEISSNYSFIKNLLPILKQFTKSENSTIVIVTKNKQLASSTYYDQCILLDQFPAC